MFKNLYRCSYCDQHWSDIWDCVCNDNCPNCQKSYAPYKSVPLPPPELLQNETQIVYATVRIVIKKNHDILEVMEDVDYSFKHKAITETEIIDVKEEPGG